MPAHVYTDKDGDLAVLKDKTLAVIGFGSQGHAHALNLKESGCKVIIGLYAGSKSVDVAKNLGFEVYETAEAVRRGDVIMLAMPDMVQRKVYETEIEPNLSSGKTLLFVHGFNIHYDLIKPAQGVDVIMVAPKGPGHVVRSQYKEGKGVPALIAIHEGSSDKARDVALAWAKGIGSTRGGVIETSFREETETDLFGEQAVLCGGASALVKAGYDVLVEAGYQPEMAYFECCHELKLIVDMIVESGLAGMRFSISDTAEYGDYTRGPRVVTDATKQAMREILKEIQDGRFAREWVAEHEAGYPKFNQYRKENAEHSIEGVGSHLRSLMPWIKKRNLQGAQASYSE